MAKPHLSPAEVAAVLGLSESEVREQCRTGEIPARKLGPRRWGILPQFLDLIEEENTGQWEQWLVASGRKQDEDP